MKTPNVVGRIIGGRVMNCRRAQRRLATFRPDDQLPPQLEAHLRQCALCRSVFESDRALWGLLAEDSVEEVLRRYRARTPEWFSLSLVPTRGLAAAAAAVVTMGVISGFWCGRTLIDLRFSPVAPALSAAPEAEEASMLSAIPPGSIVAAYLDLESEPER